MTTTAAPTREELQAQLEEYRQQIADAQAEIGAAALDNTSPSAVARQRKLKAARDGAEVTEAAPGRASTAASSSRASETRGGGLANRKLSYDYAAAFMARIEAVMVLQAELRAAEEHLLAVGQLPGGGKIANAQSGPRGDATSIDLDADVAAGLPRFPSRPKRGETIRFYERFTVERARELRELAELRAAEEAAGEGVDFSGVPTTRERRSLERRAARRAERAPE